MRILLIYIEPTPYIIDLMERLKSNLNGSMDVLFLGENISQNWNMKFVNDWMLFPKGLHKKLQLLAKLFFKNKYDIIHIAGWGEIWRVVCIFLARLTGARVTIQSDTPISHNKVIWKRMIKRMIYPALFRCVNLFLPGGKRQAKYIEHYGVKPKRIIPIQMTVDTVSIRNYIATLKPLDRQRVRASFDISETHTVFLYVGRLEIYKGIMDLLVAFALVQDQHAKLFIVGDGTEKQHVEAATLNNKNIHYLGRQTEKNLLDIYFAADVLILPSHYDHWGLVVNEAMTVGLPVIVSDQVGCIDDLIFHQESGLVVKSGSPAELCAAIESLAKSPDMRKSMENKARQIIKDWTLENEASNICNAWNKLISTP